VQVVTPAAPSAVTAEGSRYGTTKVALTPLSRAPLNVPLPGRWTAGHAPMSGRVSRQEQTCCVS